MSGQSTIVKLDSQAVLSAVCGITKLEQAVKSTLGPKGRVVFFCDDKGGLVATKDGVSVARQVMEQDSLECAAALAIKMAAEETVKKAGDGTSSVIVMAASIVQEGVKLLASGVSSLSLKKGMDVCVETVLKALDEMVITGAQQDELIKAVAMIATNNDVELGALIGQALDLRGSSVGGISVVTSDNEETKLEVLDGAIVDSGYVSASFINNEKQSSVDLEGEVYILVLNSKLDNMQDIVGLLEQVVAKKASLVIFAADFSEDVISMLVMNKIRSGCKLCAIKIPGFGDSQSAFAVDIAVITGAEIIDKNIGMVLDKVSINMLGKAKQVICLSNKTTIIGGCGISSVINNHMQMLESEYAASSGIERENIEKHMAILRDRVCIIKVGATTEADMNEKKDRLDDALQAAYAASVAGVVPGGGISYMWAAKSLDSILLSGEEVFAKTLIQKACSSITRAIVTNCGRATGVVLDQILKANQPTYGYDGLNDCVGDLVKAKVVDPLLVVKNVIENASSVAMSILSIGAAVVLDNKLQNNGDVSE